MAKNQFIIHDEEENLRIQKLSRNPFMWFILKLNTNGLYLFIAVFAWITIGAGLYKHYDTTTNTEWIDALYWADITFWTVGFGDFAPKTVPGKLMTMVYVPGAGVLWALVLVKLINLTNIALHQYSHREQEENELDNKHVLAESRLQREIRAGKFGMAGDLEAEEARIQAIIQEIIQENQTFFKRNPGGLRNLREEVM